MNLQIQQKKHHYLKIFHLKAIYFLLDLNQQSNIDRMDIIENNPDIPESPQTPEHNEPPPPPNSSTNYMEGGHKTKQKKLIYNLINQKRE